VEGACFSLVFSLLLTLGSVPGWFGWGHDVAFNPLWIVFMILSTAAFAVIRRGGPPKPRSDADVFD
jgi:hypothetical protein